MRMSLRIAATVVAVLVSAGVQAQSGNCRVHLGLKLTPDAADTSSSGFLKSLIADPTYALKWIKGDDTSAVVDLSGPGSDTGCAHGVDLLTRSAHVVDVKVLEPNATDAG